jgi:hypothetical protein
MVEKENSNDREEDAVVATAEWKLPAQWSWAIALLGLVLLPAGSGVLQLLASPQSTYAEMRLPIAGKVLVVAKNSGTSRVQLISDKFLMHVCSGLGGDFGFIPTTLGTIPPACYSIAIIPATGAAAPSAHVRFDDVEIKPSRLRMMTPLDEMQAAFVSIVVIGGLIWLCLVLHAWWMEDSLTMTGRR